MKTRGNRTIRRVNIVKSAALLLAVLGAATFAQAAIVYVDADPIVSGSPGNTARSDGVNWTNLQGGDAGSAGGGTQGNNWKHRSALAYVPGGSLLEADNGPSGNNHELVTTISGLTPGTSYDVYGYQEWKTGGQIHFGITGAGSATAAPARIASTGRDLFAEGGGTGNSAAGHFTAVIPVGTGEIHMREHYLAAMTADGSGQIKVFTKDGTSSGESRTWYSGVGYAPAAPDSAYASAVKSQNPTEYWRMNESSGVTTAAAQIDINNFAGIASGVTPGDSSAAALRPGGGFAGFSATNTSFDFLDNASSVVHAIPNIMSSDQGSVSYWVKPDAGGGTQIHYFGRPSSGGGQDFSGNVLHTWHNNDGRIGIFAGGADLRTTPNFLSMGEWHHVTTTWDRNSGAGDGEIHMYVDGAEIFKTAAGTWSSFDFSGHHRFGKGNTNDRPLNGVADELAVWTSALSSAQVLQQYAAGRLGTPAVQLITNGDLEDNNLANTGDWKPAGSAVVPGWVFDVPAGTAAGVVGETRSEVNDDPGDDSAWLLMQHSGARAGQAIGDVSDLLGEQLLISYQMTRRSNESTDLNHELSLIAGTDATFVGGDVLASLTDTSSLTNNDYIRRFDQELTAAGATGFDTLWLVFERTADYQLMLDDVSAVRAAAAEPTDIPEPATMALLGLAGVGLGGYLRRRRS